VRGLLALFAVSQPYLEHLFTRHNAADKITAITLYCVACCELAPFILIDFGFSYAHIVWITVSFISHGRADKGPTDGLFELAQLSGVTMSRAVFEVVRYLAYA